MKTTKITYIISAILLSFCLASCSDDILDRPQQNNPDDDNYWVAEENLRYYANEYYTQFFPGYNSTWTTAYTPVRGFYFNDDVVGQNVQPSFEVSIPNDRGSNAQTKDAPAWMDQYSGPTWYFGWIRKSNHMIERMERMSNAIPAEAYNHWSSVARFFRALDYCGLVSSFGDVPYYTKVLQTNERDLLYKDRTPRNDLMDSLYNEFKAVLKPNAEGGLRDNDGPQMLNRYVAAGFVSRWMLFEGTWQKYHNKDNARAQKFLEFAVEAADIVMGSGKYEIQTDFRTLFGSDDLSGNKECLLFRHYDGSVTGATHSVATYCNRNEQQGYSANLALIKSFICNDGEVWQNSKLSNANKFNIANLVKTRDPRFEATFWNAAQVKAISLLYTVKFIDRVGPTYFGSTYPAKYNSATNTNDAPVMRYGEVILNWIEAKAELENLGVYTVSQTDIERSINQLRNRPLDAIAQARGVVKTKPLTLVALPDDPNRDSDITSKLIWEVRRERRMEMYSEFSRLLDLKRWKKLNYMDGSKNQDILRGVWVNVEDEADDLLNRNKINILKVQKEDGTIVTYNGKNDSQMVGYYLPEGVQNRNLFSEKHYLSPIGKGQIDLYRDQGYTLTQTRLWD